MADASVTAGRRSTGWGQTSLLTWVVCHCHLTTRTPGRQQKGTEDKMCQWHQNKQQLPCVGTVFCVIYRHWCFLHRSVQRRGLRQGWLLHASLEHPEVTPRLSSTVTKSLLCPSRGRTCPLKRTSRRHPGREGVQFSLESYICFVRIISAIKTTTSTTNRLLSYCYCVGTWWGTDSKAQRQLLENMIKNMRKTWC